MLYSITKDLLGPMVKACGHINFDFSPFCFQVNAFIQFSLPLKQANGKALLV